MSEAKKIEAQQHQPGEPRKVGVYVCRCGGNISDHVDVEKVCEQLEKTPGVAVTRHNLFMCSDPGQELIMEDIKSGKVDRVVVASCAPSLHETTFRNALVRAGANPYIYEHANIREQVSWVHHGAAATAKATRLVAAAAAKAERLQALDPIRVDAVSHATVIGGGVAGLKAAAEVAARGMAVTLIEKSPFLGGRTAQWDQLAPTGESAREVVSQLAHEVISDPNITVLTCAEVTAFDGYVGQFSLTVERKPPTDPAQQEKLTAMAGTVKGPGAFVSFTGIPVDLPPAQPEAQAIQTGVVILATGFRPYEPRKGEYGYGELEQVITLPDLIHTLAQQPPGKTLTVGGREIRSIAMIHCVGSRQIPGIHEEREDGRMNEYCSRTCCSALLHAANRIREHFPETHVYDFYRDIRTYGRGQEELYTQAAHNRVLFLRFEAADQPVVMANARGTDRPLLVRVKDTLTFGEEVAVPVDLVVLAVGMEPSPITELIEMMKLPVGEDRFLQEVHPKLRPVELAKAGLLLAGTCQSPMDVGEACSAAASAAVKASAILGRGFVELDPFVAEVDLDRCSGTGACVEACLNEGALRLVNIDRAGESVQRAWVNPALCLGCGACVAVCPESAIQVKGWTLNQYEAMVDAIVAEQDAA